MKKLFAIATMMLAFVVSGFAQTTYTTPYFSATFNSSVTVSEPYRNPQNTSSSVDYESSSNGVLERVTVRTIDHDIAVDYSSSDFYANYEMTQGKKVVDPTKDYYYGHPFTYTNISIWDGGDEYWRRSRWIIANSRTLIVIQMFSSAEKSDHDLWETFENTLSVK